MSKLNKIVTRLNKLKEEEAKLEKEIERLKKKEIDNFPNLRGKFIDFHSSYMKVENQIKEDGSNYFILCGPSFVIYSNRAGKFLGFNLNLEQEFHISIFELSEVKEITETEFLDKLKKIDLVKEMKKVI